VWKLIESSKTKDTEVFTYEGTREKAKPSGVYPSYTFIRRIGDNESDLLFKRFTGQIRSRSTEALSPIEIDYDYLILTPSANFIMHDVGEEEE
jgi:hypothetical protein